MYKDNFLSAIRCDRCGKSLESGRIMSIDNDDVICMDCKEKEMKKENYNVIRPGYNKIKYERIKK